MSTITPQNTPGDASVQELLVEILLELREIKERLPEPPEQFEDGFDPDRHVWRPASLGTE